MQHTTEQAQGHTKGPWDSQEVFRGYSIGAEGVPTIALVHDQMDGSGAANATFIVTACNAHDDLLAACKAAAELHAQYHVLSPHERRVFQQLRTAIEKAEAHA